VTDDLILFWKEKFLRFCGGFSNKSSTFVARKEKEWKDNAKSIK